VIFVGGAEREKGNERRGCGNYSRVEEEGEPGKEHLKIK
jgi:hypothetical protein